jgi:hypothetical protein
MIHLKNILSILLFSLILISCGQTNNKQQSDEKLETKRVEKKFNKIISDSTNILTGKIENIEAEYTPWGCACPQWITTKDLEMKDTTTNFIDKHFYIEQAENSLEIPVYFDPFRHKVIFKGQFYKRKDYPQGTIEMEEPMPKAKVFRYSEIEILDKPNFKSNSIVETLTLIYNSFSCTCAQWSETPSSNDKDQTYYWLEPANKKLINADSLFNGNDLPIIIKVKGQIVSENGFPKKELPKVEHEEAGKVFRYTKIVVLQNGQK